MLSRARKEAILTKIAQDNYKKKKVTTGTIDAGSHAIPTISFDSMKPAKTEYTFKDEPIVGSASGGGTSSPKPPSVPKNPSVPKPPKPGTRLMNKNRAPKPFDMKGFFDIIDKGHQGLKGNKV